MTDDAYRATQSQIYSLQETLLDSNKSAKADVKDKDKDKDKEKKKEKKVKSSKKRKTDEDRPSKRHSKKVEEVLQVVSNTVIPTEAPRYLGTLQYNYAKEGVLNAVNVVDRKDRTTVPFPYDLERRVLPVPFLPEFPEESANSIITISIKYEDLMKSFNDSGECPRTFNNEIWGCDVYTDDTDPILALRHCGFTCLDPPPLTPTHFKGKASHKPSTPAP